MSSADTSAGLSIPGSSGLIAAARDGVREVVARSVSGHSGRRWVVPLAAAAAVAAAACAPIAWPLLAGGALVGPAALTALFGQVGGMGSGLLSEAVIRAWDRLQDREHGGVEQSEFRDALAAELKEALTSSSPTAAGLRAELAGVLHGVDAVRVALTTTVETTVRESGDQVRAVLIRGLRDLGTRFTEFGWLLEEVNDQIARIAESQAELAAGSRAMLEAQQQTLMQLTILLQQTRSARTRDSDPDGTPKITSASMDEERAATLDADNVPVSLECPYPGLASFEPRDASRFFGRQQLTAVLLTRLAEQLTNPGLLMVLGPSGSGKSSLLRAGLLPTIAAGGLPARESSSWPRDLMTPGRRPLLELATRVAALACMPAGRLNADLHTDPARITAAIRQALFVQAQRRAQFNRSGQEAAAPVIDAGTASDDVDRLAYTANPVPSASADASHGPGIVSPRLVLIVDQFEEVFTQCTDEREREAFVHALCAAAGATDSVGPPFDSDGKARGAVDSRDAPALVIIGLRADFYARSAAYPDLVPYLQDRQVLVGPMDQAGLRAAIEGPAASAGLVVDAGLVEVLLADLGVHPRPVGLSADTPDRQIPEVASAEVATGSSYEVGRLPLLAYALQQTWQYRESRRLTVAAYRATGGIDQAVARAADAIYEGLNSDGKQIARRLLLRLVNLGEGTADTRRRATVAELTGGTSEPVARKVLGDLIQARLLTTDTATDGADTVEISHEALLSAWPKLHKWLNQDRAGQRIRRDLTDAAHAWQAQGRDPSLLFSGTRLTVAREWATSHGEELNRGERAFLTACQRRKRRATRLRRTAAAALVILTVLSVGAAVLAVQQNRQAHSERDQAIANELTAEVGQLQNTDPSLAAQLDLVARRLLPTADNTSQILGTTNTPLSDQLAGPTGPVTGVAFSPSGRTLAIASDDGTVRLRNVIDPTHPAAIGKPLDGRDGKATSLAFSRDGNTLAVASSNGSVLLWNVTNPARPALLGKPLTGPGRYVSSVAFSPDGHVLAAGSYNNTIWLWNVTSPARPAALGHPLKGATGSILSLAFSPDGKTLAAGNYGDTVWLWNVTDPARATPVGQPLKNSGNPAWAIAFSPDGVLAVSNGDTFSQWNVTDPKHAIPEGFSLSGGADNTVLSMAFSPNGNILAVASGDDTIRLWNVANPVLATLVGQPLTGHSGPVYSVAFSPDGYTLASGSGDDTARLWNLPSTILTGHTSTVGSVAFSRDGSMLATGSNDDTIQLWDVTNPAYPAALGQPLFGANGSIASVAFSPDGRTLAAGGSDDTIRLWDLTNRAHPTSLGQPLTGPTNSIRAVAFSPDGRTLAAGSNDWTTRLWNVTNPAHPAPLGQPLYGHTNYVLSVAFSPNGRILATASSDDTILLWNVTNPAHPTPLGRPLSGPTNSIFGVTFSQDGRTLAAGSSDDKIWLWSITNPAHATPIGQPITDASPVDSIAFQPGTDFLATGNGDGTTQLWNLNVDQAINRICATTGDDLTRQQWATYVRQLPYAPPCSRQASQTSLAPISNTTSPTQARTSDKASILAGTWNGVYYCTQGETGLRLVIRADANGELNATFNGYPLTSNPGVPVGSFAMTGSYSAGRFVLMPDYWINRPLGYFMVGLTGELAAKNRDMISGGMTGASGCTTFSLQKS